MSHEEQLVSLEVRKVRIDGGTQVRQQIDSSVVEEYVDRICSGDVFPPIVVFFDGQDHWLADGFHRLRAFCQLQRAAVECRLLAGTRRDALLFALKANNTHGLRRTNADKRHAVELVLADEEWAKKSDRWIAHVCGVGHDLVGEVRRKLADSASSPQEGDVRVGQDGKLRHAGRTTSGPALVAADAVEQALHAADKFDRCLVDLKKLATTAENLARGPGGKYLMGNHLDGFRTNLRQAADHLSATRPSTRCGSCGGAGCPRCAQHGWLCPAAEECG